MDFQVLTFSNVSMSSDRVSCVDVTGLSLAAGRAQNPAGTYKDSFELLKLLQSLIVVFNLIWQCHTAGFYEPTFAFSVLCCCGCCTFQLDPL